MARTKQTSKKLPQKYKKATFKKKQKQSSSSQGRSGASGWSDRDSWALDLPPLPPGRHRMILHSETSDSSDSSTSFDFYDSFDDEEDEDEVMGHDDLDDEVYFGKLQGTIVGLQYYHGTVNPNEYVALEREPNNQYDINAIKVKNVGNIQVGHIKRDLARPLAFIVDKGLARMEGIVPCGMNNVYSMQVDLSLWGKPENYNATANKLKSHGYYLVGENYLSGKQGSSSSGSAAVAMAPAPPVRTYLSPAEVKNELDKLFENIKEGDKTTCADPAKAICTPLYPHQKQALNWLMSRENSTALPPFWQERNKRYFNSVLNFTTDMRPESVKGGILADDMGLGKTLEMITLIVTNFVDGQPLATPVAGLVRRSKMEKTAQGKAKMLPSVTPVPTSVPSKKIRLIIDRTDSQSCHKLGEIHPLLGSATDDIGTRSREGSSTQEANYGKKFSNESFNPELNKTDPDFSPEDKSAKFPATATDSRPKRSSKRPTRYVYSSEEDELINEETSLKKAKQDSGKGKAAATGWSLKKGVCGNLEESFDSGAGNDSSAERRKTGEAASKKAKEETRDEPVFDLPDLDKVTSDHSKVIGQNISEMKASLFKKVGQELEEMSEGGEPFWTVIAESPAVGITRKEQKEIELSKKPGLEFLDMLSDRGYTVSQLWKMLQGTNMKDAMTLIGQHLQEGSVQNASSTASRIKAEVDTSVAVSSCDTGTEPCSSDTVIVCTDYNKPSTLEIGPSTGRTSTTGPRCTLIVCPLSVLSNWLSQFEEHVHRSVHLAIYLYYGQMRTRNSAVLEKHDVIITTYATVAADFKKSERNALSKVKWLRIVLDEGHTIKNPRAQQTKAINQLTAERKWVLTGTPIQNSMKDLWSLINFLQVNPFTDRHWWTRTIERPLERGNQAALTKIQHLMGHLSLRRTKTQQVDGKPLVALPERRVYIEHIELTQEERAMYEAMQKDGRLIVNKYCRQGTLLHNYSQVLAILMRLRQICCHPFLVAKAANAVKETLASLDDNGGVVNEELRQKLVSTLIMVLSSGTDEECAVCLDSLKTPVITPCAHVYCRPCIESVIRNEQPQARCPLCRGDIQQDKLLEVPPEKLQGECGKGEDGDDVMTVDKWKSSAKVDALMNALLKLRSEDSSIKSVVVSQFTSLLTLLEVPLRTNGFSFVRLDGTMNTRARMEAIRQISDPSPGSPTIILLSLRAGGVGINLTAASRVFLLDPAWNPAVEEQCFDRCHRLGQKLDVIITKFIVDDSVETRMLQLQERKRRLMQGAFGQKQTAEEKRQERIRDIKTLLDI